MLFLFSNHAYTKLHKVLCGRFEYRPVTRESNDLLRRFLLYSTKKDVLHFKEIHF